MTTFDQDDLVPLWNRPPGFLPLRPPSGLHHWSYAHVRSELVRVSASLDKASGERRVALLAHPDLQDAAATEGLHAGLQMLLAGEAADAHRHTPSALRIGIEATDAITMVDDDELPLHPLDVVLNPSGTWHGHVERGGTGAVWLDVVDLPLVSSLGAVLFEPSRAHQSGDLLDPPSIPSTRRFPWADIKPLLEAETPKDGVRSHSYAGGSLLPTIGVTAHAIDAGAQLELPARTGGAIVLIADGEFDSSFGPIEQHDVVSLRSWTPLSLTTAATGGVVMVIDTAPALRALGLYREETSR